MNKLLSCLVLTLGMATSALADGIPVVPIAPVAPPVETYSYPRHIYRDGNYFFCPYADYDPYCKLPSDSSWALYGSPWRQRPPVISVPVPNSLNAPHVPFAAYARPPGTAVAEPEGSVDESRERVIRMGEEHCSCPTRPSRSDALMPRSLGLFALPFRRIERDSASGRTHVAGTSIGGAPSHLF